ncbi:MAG: GyrI-like domain-containing protein [Candidatus Omnitrophica bacterium]|nr:GyrI-like domain-containing protein [Candidatus Omnitrophota bacterium]
MKAAEKLDLFQLHKTDYAAPKKPVLVHIPQASYLSVSGQGEPGGTMFTEKIGALYGVAYTIKMTLKFARQQDYVVCKLEGQWWCGECGGDFAGVPKDRWRWNLLIRTPDFVKEDDLAKAIAVLIDKGKSSLVREVKLESVTEGDCVQMLHVGPYDSENETIALMNDFAEKNGVKSDGRHHEIYLSDPRRVAPERLRTILRQPVSRIA